MAQYLEDHDTHSSVTLVFASCSGARSDHLWKDKYAGIEPGVRLPPQIEQVTSVLGNRKVDAVIMSIGINDLYFGPIMKFCIASDLADKRCENRGVKVEYDQSGHVSGYSSDDSSKQTLADATATQLRFLPGRFRLLKQHLDELPAAHVFVTQYPETSHDQNAKYCTLSSGPFPRFYTTDWQWLTRTGQSLNAEVSHTSAFGWTPITGIPEDFLKHGYCSTDSYFVPVSRVVSTWNLEGSFHPTEAGQELTFIRTRDAVCEALYGNPTCDGIPPTP
jgi:hypothetical protein